jgi:TRAP-type mannitol/chloroaromatic compound transport system permease small subunit
VHQTTATDAPGTGRLHPAQRYWTFVTDSLAVIATVFIAVLMTIICADIVFRNGLGSSLPLVSELGAMIVVLIVALQLPSAVAANRLARVELVMDLLATRSPKLVALVNAVFALIGAVTLAAVAWSSFGIFQSDLRSHDFIGTPGLGTLPTWPFRALITLGFAVSALEFLFRAIGHSRQVLLTERPLA